MLKGTPGNGGVSLVPFNGLESKVPVSGWAKLDEIKRAVAGGSISVGPATYLGSSHPVTGNHAAA